MTSLLASRPIHTRCVDKFDVVSGGRITRGQARVRISSHFKNKKPRRMAMWCRCGEKIAADDVVVFAQLRS